MIQALVSRTFTRKFYQNIIHQNVYQSIIYQNIYQNIISGVGGMVGQIPLVGVPINPDVPLGAPGKGRCSRRPPAEAAAWGPVKS